MAEYKVVNSEQLDADLKVVADAIRAKCGETESLAFPNGMKSAIETIKTSSPYVLMGNWQFNEIVSVGAPEEGFGTQEFKFYGTFKGVDYASADAYFTASGYMWSLTVDGNMDYLYGGGSNYWDNLPNRVVGFGDEPQEVSQAFYEWFTANATTIYEAIGDFSTGYNDESHSLWGVWRLNSDPRWAMSSGNPYINFTFYGYVDGVYKNGVSAEFQDTYTGPTYLYVDGVRVWEYMSGTEYLNKLTDNIVGFGLTPQVFTDTVFYSSFKGSATKIF